MAWGTSVTKLGLGVVGVALLVFSLGVALWEIRARRAAEDAFAVAERNSVSRLAARSDRKRLDAAEQQVADSARDGAVTRGGQSASASSRPSADGEAFLERHPDVRQALIERSNAKLNYRWGAFCRALRLTPAQIARFQALMREGETYRAGEGADGTPLSFHLGTGLPRSEVEAQLRALLGDDGIRRLQEYGATIPARELITPLAGALHVTETPLTADQAERLVQILTQNRVRPSGPQGSRFEWNAVTIAAAGVLSPPQLTALAGVRAQDLIQNALDGARLSEAPPQPDTIGVP
jgi:hypothetical protein